VASSPLSSGIAMSMTITSDFTGQPDGLAAGLCPPTTAISRPAPAGRGFPRRMVIRQQYRDRIHFTNIRVRIAGLPAHPERKLVRIGVPSPS
jgi:hypothetical protein